MNKKEKVQVTFLTIILGLMLAFTFHIAIEEGLWTHYTMPETTWYWNQIEPMLDANQVTLVNLLNKEVFKNNRTADGHLSIQDVYDIQQFIHSQIKSYDRNYTVLETIRERRGDCTEKGFLQYQLLQAENLDNQSQVYIVLLLIEDAESIYEGKTLNHVSSLVIFNKSFIYSDAMLFDATWYLNMTNIFNESTTCEDFIDTQNHIFELHPLLTYDIGFLLSDYQKIRFSKDMRMESNLHVCQYILSQMYDCGCD